MLDAYFVYTSSLGTHTFFMIMLPIFYFFGAPHFGRGYVVSLVIKRTRLTDVSCSLLLMLSAGVYVSSFMKDLCCVPRPYAPPVTRLSEFSLALCGSFLAQLTFLQPSVVTTSNTAFLRRTLPTASRLRSSSIASSSTHIPQPRPLPSLPSTQQSPPLTLLVCFLPRRSLSMYRA